MRIAIVHGYSAAPADHWFPWLAGKLGARGHEVVVVTLPDSTAPVRSAWERTLSEVLGAPDEHTVVVTHSLGTVTTLRWLAAQPTPWRLRGLVTVAGFQGALTSLPDLDEYLAEPLDVGALRGSIDAVTAIFSDDDPFVPPAQSRQLAGELGARQVEVPGAGHFLGDEGYTELPAALDAVEQLSRS